MIERWKSAFTGFVKAHLRWVILSLALVVLLAGLLIPLIRKNLAFDRIPLEDTVRITLVRYTGEPFSSPVDWIRQSEDQGKNDGFVTFLREGSPRVFTGGETGSDVLFFHLNDGEVLPAFVDEGQLGFQYGRLWVKVEDWNDFYDAMSLVELVNVKDLEAGEELEQ